MYSINDKQIDYILNDIRRRGVEMEDLQSNLLDHICCIVEQNLKSDGDFEDFYKKTIPKFFKHELWEIEEETILLLTYKNYYTMKKAMIYGGVFSLSLIALGTAFKIMHWPGAAPLLILGFLILCFVFFPSALYLNYNPVKKNIGANLFAFLGGTALMLGILFKTMHWPMSGLLLIIGWVLLLGVFIPLLLFSKIRENIPPKEKGIYALGAFALILFESATFFKIFHWPGTAPLLFIGSFLLIVLFIPLYTNMQIKANKMNAGQFVFVITLSIYAVVLTSLMAMNVSKHSFQRLLCDEANNANIVRYFEKKKERLISEMATDSTQSSRSENSKLMSENATKTLKLIQAVRLELVQFIEGVDKTTAQELIHHPDSLGGRMDNYDWVNHLFLDELHTQYAFRIRVSISNYKYAALKANDNKELRFKINRLLNTDDEITAENRVSWEETNFRNNPLIGVLVRLSDIEKNIYIIETDILTQKN